MDLPPPLEYADPPCSICHKRTDYRNGRLHCDECGASWDAHSWAASRWEQQDPRQCPSTRRDGEWRCVLPQGHRKRRHRSVRPFRWWED